jgi:hypothetical protein
MQRMSYEIESGFSRGEGSEEEGVDGKVKIRKASISSNIIGNAVLHVKN